MNYAKLGYNYCLNKNLIGLKNQEIVLQLIWRNTQLFSIV
jgi:hypothetical protein